MCCLHVDASCLPRQAHHVRCMSDDPLTYIRCILNTIRCILNINMHKLLHTITASLSLWALLQRRCFVDLRRHWRRLMHRLCGSSTNMRSMLSTVRCCVSSALKHESHCDECRGSPRHVFTNLRRLGARRQRIPHAKRQCHPDWTQPAIQEHFHGGVLLSLNFTAFAAP
jgi:hypothetical protein